MADNVIKFSSLTQAIKAKNLLKMLKIKSQLERISGKNSINGCAYQLRFNYDIRYIKNQLIKNKIQFIS